jgi:hypothetical protein
MFLSCSKKYWFLLRESLYEQNSFCDAAVAESTVSITHVTVNKKQRIMLEGKPNNH